MQVLSLWVIHFSDYIDLFKYAIVRMMQPKMMHIYVTRKMGVVN